LLFSLNFDITITSFVIAIILIIFLLIYFYYLFEKFNLLIFNFVNLTFSFFLFFKVILNLIIKFVFDY